MKVLTAVLLVCLMIGMTPAFAAEISAADQTVDPTAVKGKGIDIESASGLTGQNESGNISEINNGMSNKTTGNLSIVKEVNAENSTISKPTAKIDTSGVVMQSTSYNCGPAALATVLNYLGINATEQELATLAGTDESGTTMCGLVRAAQAKGLKATGMKISVDELKKNNIVFLNISGITHYSVVKEVTVGSIKLADPGLGNIEMSKKKFNEVYSGNALVMDDPNANLGSTIEMSLPNMETPNSTVLDENQMLTIKGKIAPIIIVGGICIMCATAYIYWSYREGQRTEARSSVITNK